MIQAYFRKHKADNKDVKQSYDRARYAKKKASTPYKRELGWESKLQQLVVFKKKFLHTNVPQRYAENK